MANRNAPRGLQLYSADTHPQAVELCVVPSGLASPVGKGDAVKTGGTSAAVGRGPNVKTVTRISAGDAIYGVIVGVAEHEALAADFSLDRTHRPASTNMYVYVRPANHHDVYCIQADDEGATLAAVDVGLNANITGNGGGTTITDCSTTTGMSTMVLDTSTKATTATLQLKIIGFLDSPDNVIGETNPKVLVRINNAELAGGTGTAGV